jgi:hypothetical protein
VQINVQLQTHVRTQFLRPSSFEIVLGISAHISNALIRIHSICPIKLARSEYSIGGGEKYLLHAAWNTELVLAR